MVLGTRSAANFEKVPSTTRYAMEIQYFLWAHISTSVFYDFCDRLQKDNKANFRDVTYRHFDVSKDPGE